MARPIAKVGVTAADPDRTLRLSELRDLVDATAHLPADSIVRGSSVPFRMADLGHGDGLSIERLTVTTERTTP